jgi:hypothetical protein
MIKLSKFTGFGYLAYPVVHETLQQWNRLSKYVIEKQIGIEITKGRLCLVFTEFDIVKNINLQKRRGERNG